jgi:N-acetyl-gamma-glutamyl-phosphate reductase
MSYGHAVAYRIGVIGASGYTGAEVLRLAAGHSELEVVHATADSQAGKLVGQVYPSLIPAYPHLELRPLALADLAGLDLAIVALPHGESQAHMPALVDAVPHVVDIGADFRLPADGYRTWYGEDHTAPGLLDRFAFGMVELFRDDVRSHAHVANPGCYPTAASLALAPFVEAGWVEPTGIVVNALSGVSGRGRGLSVPSLYGEANESAMAYGLVSHRHTAEIELALSHVSTVGPVQVLFTPHLVPMTRGIVATCTARPAVSGLSTARLLDLLRDRWAGEPFVVVRDDPPATRATYGSNAVHVTARYDDRTGTLLAIAVEDNLVKGASGQALQNANVLLGLPEALGLPAVGIAP